MAFVEDDGRGPFVGNDGRGLFVWERGMLMTCLMRTMRQKGFFRQMDIIPQALSRPSRSPPSFNPASPFLVNSAAPFPSIPQPLSRQFRSPFPVLPAVSFPSFPQSPPSVIPAVFSGNPRSEQSFPRGQSGVISLRQGEYDL